MGMDVYGKRPTAPAGRYFRNSCWWWRPLASYAQEIAPAITSRCKYWQSNDGDGLGKRDSLALAARLREEIESGRAKAYADAYEEQRKALPRVPCEYCSATGIRSDQVGVQHGFTEKIVPSDDTNPNPRAGQKGWCNACDGRGTREAAGAMYPFSLENVAEFAAFLEACGGFKIC